MAEHNKTELVNTASLRQNGGEAEKVYFPERLIVLAKWKFFILKFVGAAAVLSVAFSLLLPKSYTANTKVLPPQQSQSGMAAAMLSQIGPLGALVNGQIRTPSDIYVAMLHSRTVADELVNHFSLMSVYGTKLHEQARRRLELLTDIKAGKDSVISISVEDHDPQRAADLANAYVNELEKLTETLSVTEARRRRSFFEKEVGKAQDELAAAEQDLKKTQQNTGLIQLTGQAEAMLRGLMTLRAQLTAKEVEVHVMRSYATSENPDVLRAEQELAALRAQVDRLESGHGGRSIADMSLENVPGAGLEYVRKLREVKYREALLELLTKQYELARVDEARDASIVQQLDRAVPPESRTSPRRSVIVLISTFLALIVAVLSAFLLEAFGEAKENSQFAAQLHLFQFYLRSGGKS